MVTRMTADGRSLFEMYKVKTGVSRYSIDDGRTEGLECVLLKYASHFAVFVEAKTQPCVKVPAAPTNAIPLALRPSDSIPALLKTLRDERVWTTNRVSRLESRKKGVGGSDLVLNVTNLKVRGQ